MLVFIGVPFVTIPTITNLAPCLGTNNRNQYLVYLLIIDKICSILPSARCANGIIIAKTTPNNLNSY